ncbi:MAG TPA: ABC transporter ATP-binding protein [Candidatus Saccharimonadales bacterium]|nr:ABC transporter ATP-binding protein [Candidatus Saccharimonadales bacterium]
MKQEPAIVSKNLVVKKERDTILDDLSFEVTRGTVTGLIGPSGSGKTTLMRAIVGVQKYKGSLTVLGEAAGSKELRKKIGYVTQAPAIYQDLTILENIRYFGTLTGASKSQVKAIIDKVHLTEQRHQLVERLSGGQKARVSLAVALLGDPDMLVLDEPTVGLDPLLRQDLWRLFKDMALAGKTLLVSSHVMDEAEQCDNLLLLREGKLLWQDTKDELLAATKTNSVQDAFMVAIKKEGKA